MTTVSETLPGERHPKGTAEVLPQSITMSTPPNGRRASAPAELSEEDQDGQTTTVQQRADNQPLR